MGSGMGKVGGEATRKERDYTTDSVERVIGNTSISLRNVPINRCKNVWRLVVRDIARKSNAFHVPMSVKRGRRHRLLESQAWSVKIADRSGIYVRRSRNFVCWLNVCECRSVPLGFNEDRSNASNIIFG